MSIDTGSIFMVVISPPLIAISIICSCKKQLKVLPSIDSKRAHSTATMEKCTSNSKLSFRTDNEANEKHKIIITQKLPFMQIHKKIQKQSGIRSKEKIQNLPTKQSSENQTTPTIDSSCKCSEKKVIIENDLLVSPLGRSISSNASFINQRNLLLKEKDLQETKSNKSNILQQKEQTKQSSVSDDDNGNVSECNALMIDDIIVFPSEIRWKLMCTVQQVQLQNTTENRFAIKVKCTDNDLYRVKPVFTFVEPKSCAIFHIYRQDGNATVGQILFLTTSAEKTDDDPRILFADSTINN